MRHLVISILLLVLSLGSGFVVLSLSTTLRREPQKTTVKKPPVTVQSLAVRRKKYREVITAYGKARAMRHTQVRASIAGTVVAISSQLEAGNRVAQGDVLVEIDDGDLRQSFYMKKAALDVARERVKSLDVEIRGLEKQFPPALEELRALRQNLRKYRDMRKTSDLSLTRMNDQIAQNAQREGLFLALKWRKKKKEVELREARAHMAEKKAALQQAQRELDKAKIRAPYIGVIESRSVHLGDRVSPGMLLFRIFDPQLIEIPLAIAASKFGTVRKGSPVDIVLRGGAIRKAEISRVDALIRSEQRTFFAFVELTDGSIPPGAFLTCRVEGKNYDDVVAVPRRAFVGDHFFVVEEAARGYVARARTPQVQKRLPEVVLIAGGVTEGERIVVSRIDEIADGSHIALAEKAVKR